MRYQTIDPELFAGNRERLRTLLPPKSLAVFNSNDILPTNADGTMLLRQNSDIFYLSGIHQEETVLVIFPDAPDEKQREMLFTKETSELIAIWEGAKHTKQSAQETDKAFKEMVKVAREERAGREQEELSTTCDWTVSRRTDIDGSAI